MLRGNIFITSLNRADVVTLVGLAASLVAVLCILRQENDLAVAFILFAFVFDLLDGRVARSSGIDRDFGRFLDGFVDVFIYLANPFLMMMVATRECGDFVVGFVFAIMLLFVGCGVIRLSVFNEIGNIEGSSGGLAYLGLPVYWSAIYLTIYQFGTWASVFNQFLLYFLMVAFVLHAYLMLLKRPFPKLRASNFTVFVLISTGVIFMVHGLV